MSFFSLAQIEQISRTAPENLIFFSLANLNSVALDAGERFSEDCRQECIAELLSRWYLNSSSELEDILDSVFPQKEWHSLKKHKEQEIISVQTASSLPQKLWSSSEPFFMRCEVTVRKRLATLLNADGFIPVYFGNSAFFLPFSLMENECLPAIGDAAGVQIINWMPLYRILFGDNPRCRCVVHCRQCPDLPPFIGRSLMLPLYLSAKRKMGILPKYNTRRLLSTGAIENGYLEAVETDEKQNALKSCFENAYLFFPESSKLHSEERISVPLSISVDLEEILEVIRRQIEAKGLVIPSFRDAQNRLAQLEYETLHTSQHRWEVMIARLQTNMDAIQLSQDRAPESYLLCLMLKSSMYCHKGDTEKAMIFNKEAKEMARRLHLEKHLRRLEIDELVDLQDVEDFDSVLFLAKTLKVEIERLNDDDLLMRYYGTMGQAHCYGFLSKTPGFDQALAKDCFLQALHHAQKLESEQDIAQDLNYNYLWYVLFDPASEAASLAYDKAHDHIERNLQSYPKCQEKNRHFLQRLKMQAVYRRLLAGKSIPEIDYQKEDLPDNAEFWLKALTKKYLGAIAARAGNQSLAEQYFQDANTLLKQDEYSIIKLIRMTVLAEAYCSLKDESYRKNALDLFASLNDCYFKDLRSWQDYLLGYSDYPALNYWY